MSEEVGHTPVDLRARILEVIGRGGGTSFVELMRIEGAVGPFELFLDEDKNLVLWEGVSHEFTLAITGLVQQKAVVAKQSDLLVYAFDGGALELPIAKQFREYKDPRWVPVVFWLPSQLERLNDRKKGKVKK
jgi:hypothetical protein